VSLGPDEDPTDGPPDDPTDATLLVDAGAFDPAPWLAAAMALAGALAVVARAFAGSEAEIPTLVALPLLVPSAVACGGMAWYAARLMRRYGAKVPFAVFAGVGAGAGVGFAVLCTLLLVGLLLFR
jgi:hypothetical protein